MGTGKAFPSSHRSPRAYCFLITAIFIGIPSGSFLRREGLKHFPQGVFDQPYPGVGCMEQALEITCFYFHFMIKCRMQYHIGRRYFSQMWEYSYPGIQSIECTLSIFNLLLVRNHGKSSLCVAAGIVRYTPDWWHLTLYAGLIRSRPTAIKNQE